MNSQKAYTLRDTAGRTISYLSLNATHSQIRELIACGFTVQPNC